LKTESFPSPQAGWGLGGGEAKRYVLAIIAAGTLLRLVSAATVGLGVDETYMVVASRQMSAGYFDHPPVAFWIARAAAAIGGEHRVIVRLPFIALFIGTTWLMYRLTARLYGERAGVWAALALNTSAVFAVSAGGWVLPDGPLDFGLVAAAYCLVRATLEEHGRYPIAWWIAAGACTGLALLSKYHAALFMLGVMAFLVIQPAQRHWLRRPEPYLFASIALLIFLPDVLWNARHGWASFAFQLGRSGVSSAIPLATRLRALGQTIAGQATWVLPWIWVPLAVALGRTIAKRPRDDRDWLLLCLAAGPIIIFTVVALGGLPALPHWAAPGYLMAFPLVGAAAAAAAEDARALRRWLAGSAVAFVGLVAVLMSAAATGWPARLVPALVRRHDPTVELLDWSELPRGLDSLHVLHRPNTFVAGTSWIQASKVAYALGPGVHVLCLTADPRHFGFLEDERRYIGRDALIITRLPDSRGVVTRYGPYFDRVEDVGRIPIYRFGHHEFDVGVYLAHDFRALTPQPALPSAVRVAVAPRAFDAGYLLFDTNPGNPTP